MCARIIYWRNPISLYKFKLFVLSRHSKKNINKLIPRRKVIGRKVFEL